MIKYDHTKITIFQQFLSILRLNGNVDKPNL